MEMYIAIGFVVLCFAILVFVIGIFGYIVHISKKEFDAAPTTSNSNNPEEKA